MGGPVDLVLLRGMLPDVPLRPGATVTGRVLDARTLVLEGVRLAAELPDDVEPGQVLRLRVAESSGERLHLQIVERPAPEQQAQQVPQAAYALALPGGSEARVFVDEREAGARGRAGEARSVVLRYDSPALGRMDVRLEAGAAAIHVAAGEPAEAVREAAAVLAQALERATGRPTQVTVHPRGETFSASA
ncbi:MAG: hypothetical protein HZB46_15095 [Solirubrobacterales bacterium]|nr:hypothetical protein [Solirubrobacterales bacterium]